MARIRTKASAIIDLEAIGLPEVINDTAALARAQKKNAALVEERVKLAAEALVGKNGLTNPIPRNRSGGKSMVDSYEAHVEGTDVVLDNPTDRARFFEFGTEEHEIWASGLFAYGQGAPPRGRRGQFSRGSRALAFTTPRGYFFIGQMVVHPGQDATHVMSETVEFLLPEMENNILDELVEELDRRVG